MSWTITAPPFAHTRPTNPRHFPHSTPLLTIFPHEKAKMPQNIVDFSPYLRLRVRTVQFRRCQTVAIRRGHSPLVEALGYIRVPLSF